MVEVPHLGARVRVRIVGFFDLGFLVQKSDGIEAQLRATEMKKDLLVSFLNQSFPPVKEDFKEQLGRELWVYEFSDFPTRVSQYSQLELELNLKRDEPAIKAWVEKLNEYTKRHQSPKNV